MSKKASNPEPDSARPAPPPAPPERVMRCTTHHHACDCREAKFTALEKDFAYHAELCTSQQARIGALTEEVEEQARLLGTSASREAELLARVEALEKKLTKVYNALLAGIANAAAANYAEREMEAKRRLRDAMQEPSP